MSNPNFSLNFGRLGFIFFYEENRGAVCLSGLVHHFDIAVLEKTDNNIGLQTVAQLRHFDALVLCSDNFQIHLAVLRLFLADILC